MLPATTSKIGVDESYVFALVTDQSVYRAPKTGGGWTQLGGSCCMVDIAVADDSYVYGLGSDKSVYRGPKAGGGWTRITVGNVGRITVDDVAVYGLNIDGAVYRSRKEGGKFGLPDGWTKVFPPSVTYIATDNTFLYGVNINGDVYRGDLNKPGSTGEWHKGRCNDAGPVEQEIRSTVESSETVTDSLAISVSTEIEAGVIFKKAKVSVAVTNTLSTSWTNTWIQTIVSRMKCGFNQDGTPFTHGCMWQWNMRVATFAGPVVNWAPVV